MNYILLLWLIWMSIYDIKSRRIPWILLGMGAVLSAISCVVIGEKFPSEIGRMLVGLLPGMLLLALSVCTKLVGMADGIVLACLGVSGGFQKVLSTWLLSLFLSGVYSVILLALRKANRRTKIPYMPFLTIAWLGVALAERFGG